MLNRLLSVLAFCGLLSLATGCYSTQEGRVKAGIPFVKDTISSRYEVPYERVHAAAKTVIARNGTLTNDDVVTKVLRGVIDGRNVWVRLDDTAEPKITKVIIQVRSGGGSADVDWASEVDKQIYGVLLQGSP